MKLNTLSLTILINLALSLDFKTEEKTKENIFNEIIYLFFIIFQGDRLY